MASEGVLEPVNVVANGLVGFLTGVEDGAPDELGFQGLKERLHHGIVVAIPFAGHRDQDAVLAELGLIVDRAILGGFKRSSQPPLPGDCDVHSKATLGSIWTAAVVVAGPTAGRRPR